MPTKRPSTRTPARTTPKAQEPIRIDAPVEVIEKKARTAGKGVKHIKVRGRTPNSDPVIFHLVEQVPGFLVLRLGVLADDATPDEVRLSVMNAFVNVAVVPEQRYEFFDHVISADPIIGMTETQEIIGAMVKELIERP